MNAAVASVRMSSHVSPTQPQGLDAGNRHHLAHAVVRVSSGDTLVNWSFSSVELHAGAGVITSPNYPGQYSNLVRMQDRIQVEQGLAIMLQFTYFQTEKCCDHLTITDEDGTVLMHASGNSLPTNISSASNVINILFTTDHSNTLKGWSFSWSAVTAGGPTTTYLQITVFTWIDCQF